MVNKSFVTMAAACALLIGAGHANATITSYTTQSAFTTAAAGGSAIPSGQVADQVNWSSFDTAANVATNNGTVPYGESVSTGTASNQGEVVTIMNSTGVSATPFTTYVEGAGTWNGSFANGTVILYNGNTETTTLSFATALSGLGVDLQTEKSGNYTFTISAYNSSATLLGTAIDSGASHGISTGSTYEGSVMFAGILSTAANISYVTISSSNDNNGFAIDTSLIYHPPINSQTAGSSSAAPEPGTLALLGSGLAGLGWIRRKRRPV